MMGFKSASGYGGLEATPLAQIGYHNEIIMRAWERDFLPEITNTTIDERITRCNQVVQFVRQPKLGKWRRYEKNQELVASQLTPDGFTLEVCNSAYQDIKIDKQDIARACERWASWEASFLDSAYQSLSELWRVWVINGMVAEAIAPNKGANAGLNANIDLGQPGTPVVVNSDNVSAYLSRLRNVLIERQRWVDGQMFIIVPPGLSEVLAASNYSNTSWAGDCKPCSMGIDGFLPKTLWGFNVIESIYTPVHNDPSNNVAYSIVAGHREAFAFAADIIEGRLVEPSRAFSVEYQMLAVWGGRAIYPDALSVGYIALGV
jgi:hypothetical protein